MTRLKEFSIKYRLKPSPSPSMTSDFTVIFGPNGRLEDDVRKIDISNSTVWFCNEKLNISHYTKPNPSDSELAEIARSIGIHISYHDLAAIENEKETK